MPTSFPQGDPMLEVDRDALPPDQEAPPEYTSMQIRLEMRKEMLFLLPPMLLAAVTYFLFMKVPAFHATWSSLMRHQWLTGLLGSLFGALVGAFVVWLFRIGGTIGFGRVAMGLGDVHLMLGVGAVIGAAGATVTFFIAPFFGILLALWRLVTGSRREIPFGPYLSLASAFVILFLCPILTWLTPGMLGLRTIVQQYIGL